MAPPTQAEDSKRQGARGAPALAPMDVRFSTKDSQTNVYPATPAFSLACRFRPGSQGQGRLPCSSHPDECRFPPGNPSVNFSSSAVPLQHERFERPDILALGFMTFALFVGAGNIIFRPSSACSPAPMWLATLGFLITAVGLPVITVIAPGQGRRFGRRPQPSDRQVCRRPAGGGLPPGGRPAVRHSAHRHGVLRGRRCRCSARAARRCSSQPGVLPSGPGHSLPRSPAGHRRTLPRPAEDLALAIPASPPFWPAGPIGTAQPEYTQAAFSQGFVNGYLTMDTLAALVSASSSSTPSVPAACSRRG